MRRWLVILLLLIYPFQVALAMADRCCLTTPQGVTHHAASATAQDQPVYALDDEHGGNSDPHCAACVFVHTLSMPPSLAVIPAALDALPASVAAGTTPASHPAARPERPKWPARAV